MRDLSLLVRAFDIKLYGAAVQQVSIMGTVSVNRFRDNLKSLILTWQHITEKPRLAAQTQSGATIPVATACCAHPCARLIPPPSSLYARPFIASLILLSIKKTIG
jgi:hypothetical protein